MPRLLRQLLLIPLLAPLLAALVVGAVNPKPNVALRLLVWTTPALPIGVWIMLAGAGGAGLGALGSGLALSAQPQRLQRQVRRPVDGYNSGGPWEPMAGSAWSTDPESMGTGVTLEEPPVDRASGIGEASRHSTPAGAGPTRAAGESSPTVAVPYRVIRRGRPEQSHASPPPADPEPATDGWGSPLSDAW